MKQNLTLFLFFLQSSIIAFAQIPNAGFEDWTDMGSYNNPDNWSNLNNLTAISGTYTCAKGAPGDPGSSYLKLTSRDIAGMGVVPGIAVCGTLDSITLEATGGFPFTLRPSDLSGNWQHMIYGSSQGYIDVQLTRWDATAGNRVTVATGHKGLTGMAMSWASFNININYEDDLAPDTCIITLASSGDSPANNDFLYIDDLSFSGEVTGIDNQDMRNDLTVFPNPANNLLQVAGQNTSYGVGILKIYTIAGNEVYTDPQFDATNNNSIDIQMLLPGIYLIVYNTETDTTSTSFIKQ